MLRDPQISTPTIRTKSCIELLRIVVVESAKKAVRNIEDRAPGRFNSTFWDAVVFYRVAVSLTLTSHSVLRLSGYPVMKMVSWERLMKSDIWRRLFASLGKHRFEDFSWASQRLDDSAARELACRVFSWFLRSLPYVPAREFAWNSNVALRSKTPGIQDQELVRSAADHGLCDSKSDCQCLGADAPRMPYLSCCFNESSPLFTRRAPPILFCAWRFFMIFSWERSLERLKSLTSFLDEDLWASG